jgi:hypothetical protein
MALKKAQRTRLWLRCALFGPSGSGKTMTALRMAKGICRKMGVKEFAVIDTEARSASKYADRFEFIVDDLEGKTIEDYIASMAECAKAGHRVLVIDSLSHAWRELTGEVDRIAQSSTSKNTFSPWAKATPRQKRFISAILNYPGHVIATMRSKTEWVIGEAKSGKAMPEKVALAPEQGKGIEYEFDLLVELDQRHFAFITKDRTGKFQDEILEKPGEDFGSALYDWLSGGSAVSPAAEVQERKPEGPPAKTPAGEKDHKKAGGEIIQEIGKIINAKSKTGSAYFCGEEKEQARKTVKDIRLDEAGIAELLDFKSFLADELSKREAKAA